ncbi:hypothetical protein ACTHGU_14455 [Chitinophagaceae bacterium MMS25-I14]
MKKLQSLKSSRFEALKANEIQNAFAVLGGTGVATCQSLYDAKTGVCTSQRGDSYDNTTNPSGSEGFKTPDYSYGKWGDCETCKTLYYDGTLRSA